MILGEIDGNIDGSKLGKELGADDGEIQPCTNNSALNTFLRVSCSKIFMNGWDNGVTLKTSWPSQPSLPKLLPSNIALLPDIPANSDIWLNDTPGPHATLEELPRLIKPP